jgi:hypothetical protein
MGTGCVFREVPAKAEEIVGDLKISAWSVLSEVRDEAKGTLNILNSTVDHDLLEVGSAEHIVAKVRRKLTVTIKERTPPMCYALYTSPNVVWFSVVVPKYLDFTTLSKDLLAVCTV